MLYKPQIVVFKVHPQKGPSVYLRNLVGVAMVCSADFLGDPRSASPTITEESSKNWLLAELPVIEQALADESMTIRNKLLLNPIS